MEIFLVTQCLRDGTLLKSFSNMYPERAESCLYFTVAMWTTRPPYMYFHFGKIVIFSKDSIDLIANRVFFKTCPVPGVQNLRRR